MKAAMLTFFGCMVFLMSGYSLAGCGGGSCGSCNPYESNCQCTDPACSSPWAYDSDCISRAECCEAFGNIGAR